MIWIPTSAPDNSLAGQSIVQPDQVFYTYNGPAIFTARFGFFEALFYKFDELEETDLFLAVPLRRETLLSLIEGSLSVRGALRAEEAWVIEASADLSILKYWSLTDSEFPAELLPAHRTGVHPGFSHVVDSLDAVKALLSLTFEGAALSPQGMPLGEFRLLIDNAHDAARKILIPEVLTGTRSATLDFQIAEPKFSSLVLALKQPLIDVKKVERRLRSTKSTFSEGTVGEAITKTIASNGESFVHQIDEIATTAKHGEISETVARERFIVLDQVSEIVPSQKNRLSELAIATNVEGRRASVVIGAETGEKILRAREIIEATPVTDQGVVIQINSKRNTFLLQSVRGREVTCQLDEATFKTLRREGQFDIGRAVHVTGPFHRRKRRDLMSVTSLPAILDKH